MADKSMKKEAQLLKAMKKKIDEIEKVTGELKALGAGVPVVEKNVRVIMSITHALKFSISDVADAMNE